jgi:4-hydroxybenzoate polyprenyltransferase
LIPFYHRSRSGLKKPALKAFIRVARLHISFIAGLAAFTFGWVLTGVYPWLIATVCALDWFIVNLINRVVDADEDKANGITDMEFVDQHSRLLLGIGVFLLFVSLAVVHFVNPAITALRIVCHLLGAHYNWPLLPGGRRLKQIYFWKNIASGIGFLLTVFGYPLLDAYWEKGINGLPPGISWMTVAFSAVFFFLFIQSYEVMYDLRDVSGDSLLEIPTYPAVHGVRTTIHIVNCLIFSSILVLATGYIFSFVPWRIFIMTAAPFIQFIMLKRALRRGISAKDCIRITWMGVLLLFIYHVWIVAKLPGFN